MPSILGKQSRIPDSLEIKKDTFAGVSKSGGHLHPEGARYPLAEGRYSKEYK